ncbi:hypothetical protein LY474_30595 [Myxococcus stipitatus]|uniref:hypothetical protein n=1 Tax=Myxococcus stipitatus TaxID=83455 RepID=UPI001F1F3860|nr:hypothetical protein [Myxococcus stipitatus]MCE9672165.1 hypothetical protein [Myxococcus stipitatus]
MLLLAVLLAPVAATAETWLIVPEHSSFRPPNGSFITGTISGTLVIESGKQPEVALSVSFHDLVIHHPAVRRPPREEMKLALGEASFKTTEYKPGIVTTITGTFQANGKTAPASYTLGLQNSVEDPFTGQVTRVANFTNDSFEQPSFQATLVKQREPWEWLQQPEGAKTAGKGPWGVLVGLAMPGEVLKTYFITATEITPLGQGLAVPRKDGWWVVDAYEGNVVTSPASTLTRKDYEEYTARDNNCADGSTGGTLIEFLYAGPDFISYDSTFWKESCHGPNETRDRSIVTRLYYDHENDRDESSIESALGPEAKAALDPILEKRCPGDSCSDPREERYFWGLTPMRLFAAIPGGYDPTETKYETVPLPVKLLAALKRPSRHVAADLQHPLPPPGPGVTEPGRASAAIIAPDGSFELRIHDNAIVVWAGSKQVGTITETGCRLVMEEWASGKATVARWRKQAASVLANAPRPKE